MKQNRLNELLSVMGLKEAHKQAVLNGDVLVCSCNDLCACRLVCRDYLHATPYLLSDFTNTDMSKDTLLSYHYKEMLDYKVLDEVKELQNDGLLVYGIIFYNDMLFGMSYDILYLDPNETEEEFNDTLNWFKDEGCLYGYAINTKIPEYSEFGCMYFKKSNHGLARIA